MAAANAVGLSNCPLSASAIYPEPASRSWLPLTRDAVLMCERLAPPLAEGSGVLIELGYGRFILRSARRLVTSPSVWVRY